jgi:hypothetical protein
MLEDDHKAIADTVASLHLDLDAQGAPEVPGGAGLATIESLSDDIRLLVSRAMEHGCGEPAALLRGREGSRAIVVAAQRPSAKEGGGFGDDDPNADGPEIALLPRSSLTAVELRQASLEMQAKHDAMREQLEQLEVEWEALKSDAVATEEELQTVTEQAVMAQARCEVCGIVHEGGRLLAGVVLPAASPVLVRLRQDA